MEERRERRRAERERGEISLGDGFSDLSVVFGIIVYVWRQTGFRHKRALSRGARAPLTSTARLSGDSRHRFLNEFGLSWQHVWFRVSLPCCRDVGASDSSFKWTNITYANYNSSRI